MRFAAVGGALVAILLLRTSAQALVLCVPKNGEGAVQVREACKKNEVQLDPAAVGLGVQGPAVYDANGEKVGEFYSSDLPLVYVNIVLRLEPYTLPFNVDRSHIWPTNVLFSSLLFESVDCSGDPFIPAPGTSNFLTPIIGVTHPGNTVYLADAATSPQTIYPKSERQVVSGTALPPFPCVSVSSGSIAAIPATSLVDLDTLFTPPFTVK